MSSPSKQATTDGWRGLPGENWSELQLLSIVAGLAAAGQLGGKVVVGYDGRAGSQAIALLIGAMLQREDHEVLLSSSVVPTPCVGHAVRAGRDVSAGLMLTASHNAPGYFGLKVRDGEGQGVPIDIWSGASGDVQFDDLDSPAVAVDIMEPYLVAVASRLSIAAGAFADLVILDAAYGAVGAMRSHVPEVRWRRSSILPFFAGSTPDPVLRPQADEVAEAALSTLAAGREAVVAMTDGDGDRMVLFTRRSGYIDSSEQAAILLSTMPKPMSLFTTVVAPGRLVRSAHRNSHIVATTEVGFKNIVQAHRSIGRPHAIGVEPNGAVVAFLGSADYFERDALAALATMLEVFPSVDALDDAVAALRTEHPFSQHHMHTSAGPKAVEAALTQALGVSFDRIGSDTVLWEFGDERIAVRASGTEQVTRLYVEASRRRLDEVRQALDALPRDVG